MNNNNNKWLNRNTQSMILINLTCNNNRLIQMVLLDWLIIIPVLLICSIWFNLWATFNRWSSNNSLFLIWIILKIRWLLEIHLVYHLIYLIKYNSIIWWLHQVAWISSILNNCLQCLLLVTRGTLDTKCFKKAIHVNQIKRILFLFNKAVGMI